MTDGEAKRWTLLGCPSNSGSLFTGTEAAADAYRQAGILDALMKSGLDVRDGGDVAIPDDLPRHNIPPIRNWPAPRIVWDATADAVSQVVGDGSRLLLVGGDCSVVVGATGGLIRASSALVHLIAVDGHLDAVEPNAEKCVGAAAMGLGLLSTPSPFHVGPYLPQANVTTIGAADLQGLDPSTNVVLTSEVNAVGARTIIDSFLATVPADGKILVHFDVDVICAAQMPAAYSPNADGLPIEVVEELLSALVSDERTAALVVTEYTVEHDPSGKEAVKVVDLLARSFDRSRV